MAERFCPAGKCLCERFVSAGFPVKNWCESDTEITIGKRSTSLVTVPERRLIDGYEVCPWPSKHKTPVIKKQKCLSEIIAEMAINAWPSKPPAQCIIDAVEACIPETVMNATAPMEIFLSDLKKGKYL